MYQTIAGFEPATPGTYERGKAERARQDAMIQERGGVWQYMRGCVWCDNSLLTNNLKCGMLRRDKHPDTPGKSA